RADVQRWRSSHPGYRKARWMLRRLTRRRFCSKCATWSDTALLEFFREYVHDRESRNRGYAHVLLSLKTKVPAIANICLRVEDLRGYHVDHGLVPKPRSSICGVVYPAQFAKEGAPLGHDGTVPQYPISYGLP